jgi:hypothetical protein
LEGERESEGQDTRGLGGRVSDTRGEDTAGVED